MAKSSSDSESLETKILKRKNRALYILLQEKTRKIASFRAAEERLKIEKETAAHQLALVDSYFARLISELSDVSSDGTNVSLSSSDLASSLHLASDILTKEPHHVTSDGSAETTGQINTATTQNQSDNSNETVETSEKNMIDVSEQNSTSQTTLIAGDSLGVFPTFLDLLLQYTTKSSTTPVADKAMTKIDDTSEDDDVENDSFSTTDGNLREFQRLQEASEELILSVNKGLDERRKLLGQTLAQAIVRFKSSPAQPASKAELSLRGRLSAAEKRISALRERLYASRMSCAGLVSENVDLSSENTVLRRTNERLRLEASTAIEELKETKTANETLEASLKTIKASFQALEEENLSLKKTQLEGENNSSLSTLAMIDNVSQETEILPEDASSFFSPRQPSQSCDHSTHLPILRQSGSETFGGIAPQVGSTTSEVDAITAAAAAAALDSQRQITTLQTQVTDLETQLESAMTTNRTTEDKKLADRDAIIHQLEAENQSMRFHYKHSLRALANSAAMLTLATSPLSLPEEIRSSMHDGKMSEVEIQKDKPYGFDVYLGIPGSIAKRTDPDSFSLHFTDQGTLDLPKAVADVLASTKYISTPTISANALINSVSSQITSLDDAQGTEKENTSHERPQKRSRDTFEKQDDNMEQQSDNVAVKDPIQRLLGKLSDPSPIVKITAGVLKRVSALARSLAEFKMMNESHPAILTPQDKANDLLKPGFREGNESIDLTPILLRFSFAKNTSLSSTSSSSSPTTSLPSLGLVLEGHTLLALFQDALASVDSALAAEHATRLILMQRITDLQTERISQATTLQTQINALQSKYEAATAEQQALVNAAIVAKLEAQRETAAATAAFETLQASGSELHAAQYRQRIADLSQQLELANITRDEASLIMSSLRETIAIQIQRELSRKKEETENAILDIPEASKKASVTIVKWILKHSASTVAKTTSENMRLRALVSSFDFVKIKLGDSKNVSSKELADASMTTLKILGLTDVANLVEQNGILQAQIDQFNSASVARIIDSEKGGLSAAISAETELASVLEEKEMYQSISDSLGVELEVLSDAAAVSSVETSRLRAQLKELDSCFSSFSTRYASSNYLRCKAAEDLASSQKSLLMALQAHQASEIARKALVEHNAHLSQALQSSMVREKSLSASVEGSRVSLITATKAVQRHSMTAKTCLQAQKLLQKDAQSEEDSIQAQITTNMRLSDRTRVLEGKLEKANRRLERMEKAETARVEKDVADKETRKDIKRAQKALGSTTGGGLGVASDDTTTASISTPGVDVEKATALLREEKKLILEEMRDLQSKIRCSVCSKRERSVVITKCFHTFCKTCIDHAIESRQRKCPACARAFGASDVHQIFF